MFTTEQMLQLVEDYKLLILDSAEDRNAILGKNGSAKMGQKWVSLNCAIFADFLGDAFLSKKCPLIPRFNRPARGRGLFLRPPAFPIPPESL
jgi:hypothetical protein